MSPFLPAAFAILLATGLPARAVLFYDTGDPAHQRNTAPTGPYAGAGWQYQGYFGAFLGTMISPNHFITAAHIGIASGSFVSKSFFNGGPSDITYTVDATYKGVGYYTVPGTDLRIFRITGTFPDYAPLYTGSDEVGKGLVVIGRGTQRGDLVQLAGVDKGWKWGVADAETRWGLNTVSAAVPSGSSQLLVADFDDIPGIGEAHLSSGDSGGAVFIQESGIWKLAGINFGVSGAFDTNDVVDTQEFNAALTDMGGFYIGYDVPAPAVWNFIPDTLADKPSQFSATRISAFLPQITGAIPEPSSALLAFAPGILWAARRRSRQGF